MESQLTGLNTVVDRSLRGKVDRATRSVSRDTQWKLLLLTLAFSDVVMMSLGFLAAYLVRFRLNLPFFYLEGGPGVNHYRQVVLVLLPVMLAIYTLNGLYEKHKLLGGTDEYSSLFNATTIGMFGVIAFGFLAPDFLIARGWLLLAWAFIFLFTSIARFFIRRMVYWLRQHGYFLTPTIIVGANDEGLSLAKQLLLWKTSGLHVMGFVDEKLPAGAPLFGNLNILGTVTDLEELIPKYQVGEIILASSAISSRERMLEIFKRYGVASGVNVRMSSGLYEIITTGLNVKEFAYVPLVGINQLRLTGVDRFLKKMLDYGLTIPGLILIAPILLLIGLLIKLDSPGPVIHRRRVMGINGKQFDAFKFRTMFLNGDEILDNYPALKEKLKRNYKLKNDPRITRMGKLLRKLSLDELPQLLNVLKGDMSLVGPRMISPEEIEKYDQWDINLLTIPPGITGLWQVSGRSDVTYRERVQLDMHYIRNWSIWLDLQLLVQTIPAVIKGHGAY